MEFGALNVQGGDGAAGNEASDNAKKLAADYIQRFDLRQVLQCMFQQVIRERPEEPLQWMQTYLRSVEERNTAGQPARRAEELREAQVEVEALRRRVEELEAQDHSHKQHEQIEAQFAQRLGAELEGQRLELGRLHTEQMEQWRREFDQAKSSHRASTESLQRRVQELEARSAAAGGAAEESRAAMARNYEEQLEQQREQIEALRRQLQAQAPNPGGGATSAGFGDAFDLAARAATPPGDVAAGLARELVVASLPAEASAGSGGRDPNGFGNTRTTMLSYTNTTMPGSGLNTQMLAQLLSASYAGPGAERGEDGEGDGPSNAKVLVRVAGSSDAASNGTYACVGEASERPVYRLLGPEPRYLYYADLDIASGWRIAEHMSMEVAAERFLKPMDAMLPVACEDGDHGARVTACKLSRTAVGRICTIGSIEEKQAIRAKLDEAFGRKFTEFECEQRGLASMASPIVAVARALESQQHAITLLHSQLAAEAKRRDAAEQHAQTMHEAFETMRLRVQAQLPSPPTVAALQELSRAAMVASGKVPLPTPPMAAGGGGDLSPGGGAMSLLEAKQRAVIMTQDGGTSWGPDIRPGEGPVPRPPVAPREWKPKPPPTFRRLQSGLGNRLLIEGGGAADGHGHAHDDEGADDTDAAAVVAGGDGPG